MISDGHIRMALGSKYDPGLTYLIAEKGPALVSKLNQGAVLQGELPDILSAGDTQLFILSEPVKPPPPPPPVKAKRVAPQPAPPRRTITEKIAAASVRKRSKRDRR